MGNWAKMAGMALPETVDETAPVAAPAPQPRLSIVIPALDAAGDLAATLESLGNGDPGPGADLNIAEVILADGGSRDESRAIAKSHGAEVLAGSKGRGLQLCAGARRASGDWLLFLHADTRLTPGWRQEVARFIGDPANRDRVAAFRFALDDRSRGARRVEWGVHRRARWLGMPFGDQGLLISRDLYDRLGGYRPMPMMEDVNIIRRIGKRRITFFESAAITSAARYRRGYLRRTAFNQFCLALYFLRMPPRLIARIYK